MREPYTINLLEGQSVIIYHNGKVLIKKTSAECRSIFTAWESFVGSEDQVKSEIARLGLVDIKIPARSAPVTSRPVAQPAPVATQETPAAPSGNIITNTASAVTNAVVNAATSTWNAITSIFTTNNNK